MESRRVRFVDGGCQAVQGVKSFQFEEVAQGQADEEKGCKADGFMYDHQNRQDQAPPLPLRPKHLTCLDTQFVQPRQGKALQQ